MRNPELPKHVAYTYPIEDRLECAGIVLVTRIEPPQIKMEWP